MELYKRIIEIVDANLIYCLIPIILSLLLVELIFKDRFETRKALNVIRWAIVTYTVITVVFYLVGMALNPDEYAFVNRVTGSFSWSYCIMLLSALVLPLTLFIKKLASKLWYVLLVAFLMKGGLYFERFVIITTSIHRDYQANSDGLIESTLSVIGLFLLQGISIALLMLGVLEVIKK